MTTEGMDIRIEVAPGYEPPSAIRAALENLAAAIDHEARNGHDSEVEGFAQPPIPGAFNPLETHPSKWVPTGPLQAWCIGGYSIKNADGTASGNCDWVFSY